MYALINTTAFHWNISSQSTVPVFPARFVTQADGTQGASIPYSCEEILIISAEHTLDKNYYETGVNLCRACFNVLDTHVAGAYKAAPAGPPSTIGWNSTMLPNKIFEQLMMTYDKPTPDAMRQNNLTLISMYNPKDSPELLFKRCANCQEIVIVAEVPYTSKQLLMNVVDLFTHSGIYACDMDDWERKPDVDKTYVNLRPFIQAAYQRCLALGVITTTQSRYTSSNHFAGLTTNNDVLDNGISETIVESINTHMANLSATVLLQSTTSNNANMAVFNASMQQVAANKAQDNKKHNRMMQQFAMMSTASPVVLIAG
jgi:hypothetical protein